MARGGINQAAVQQARDRLLARGERPSIDAIRIELGNTGSKSTIHRHLRDLEDAAPVPAHDAPALNLAVSELVAQLVRQLQDDNDALLAQAQAQLDEQAADLQARTAAAEAERDQARTRETVLQAALEQTTEQLHACQSSLQIEQTRNARLGQACSDLQLRLDDQLQRVQSLEDQQRHSRDALQHYRESVREQRDQEQRRHETQVQMIQVEVRQLQQSAVVRQDEVTQLNRSNERLLAELAAHQRQAQQQRDAYEGAQADARQRAAQIEAGLHRQVEQQRELAGSWAQRAAQAEGAQRLLMQQLAELQSTARAIVPNAADEPQAADESSAADKSKAKKRPPSAGKAVRGVSPKD